MRTYLLFVLVLGSFLSCTTGESGSKPKGEVRIATAANMHYAMDSIGVAFEKKYGYSCTVTSNSSGMLTAQIEKGAPFDVFVSANMRYPKKLEKSGFGGTPEVYAYGRLVLVYPKKDRRYPTVEHLLKHSSIKRVAVANNRTAPYGMAADEFLTKNHFRKKYTSKLVTGESVGQVNQYLISGSVDAAFTSYSFLTKHGQDFRYIEIDPSEFEEIEQGMLILKHGKEKNREASEKLMEFIRSDEGKSILSHFGYRVE